MFNNTINKSVIRLLVVLLAAVMAITSVPAAHANEEIPETGEEASATANMSGSCGEGLTWSLNAGTLTITGSGAMTNYTEKNMAPWYHLRDEIIRLELPAGLTSIGALAAAFAGTVPWRLRPAVRCGDS